MNNSNSSLKEYYVKLQELYINAVNMLTALNQSLSTTASEVSVNLIDSNNITSTVRIPSFLYLENKIEELNNNFGNIFKMPNSGEAWFSNSSNMFKLNLVKTNNAPASLNIITDNLYASTTSNNFLKDLVNPKTYLRFNLNGISDNIDKIFMKKMIIYNESLFNEIGNLKELSYSEIKMGLYNYNKGIDYDEYDSELKMPIKKDQFISEFKIVEIPTLDSGNPWKNIDNSKLLYKIKVDTLKYYDHDDNSIEFTLKTGDFLTLKDNYAVYKIKNIVTQTNNNISEYYLILEEYVGHVALQTFEENSAMIFNIYNENYEKYHYIDVPLEENPYIIVFLGSIYNNVRSILSDGILINLNTLYIKDENSNYIYDTNSSTPMTYIEYYNKYCKNIGDLILGLTETAYPQLSNFSKETLNMLENSDAIKNYVNNTVDVSKTLVVQKINSHLTDDVTSENILKLHNQKNSINSQLMSLQSNIDQVYNQLISTDFSQEVNITQELLKSQLDSYYTERLELQKQQIAIIDNINSLSAQNKNISKSKYRIRGVTLTDSFIEYLHSINLNCDIIGLEIEYKYKSINSDTNNVTDINSVLFTDWNKITNIERERKLEFDNIGNYSIKFEEYNTSSNIIKWNQLDIPINQGEDVIVKIRYKYCIGQPFINLYTPWSDEFTVVFPNEFLESNEIVDVINENKDDSINAKFNSTLINEGYQEHINNKIIDNSQVFFHMPENIYSGFNTNENKLISLKDKLISLDNDVNKYTSLLNDSLNNNYKVYIEWDNNVLELSNSTDNNILINESNSGVNDMFIRKNMNLIIKNTGSTPIKFYSLFPGNLNVSLLNTNKQYYEREIVNYDRVPILINGSNLTNENIYYQTLGQWVYFRQTNPYTNNNLYVTANDDSDYSQWIRMDQNNITSFIYEVKYKDYISSNLQGMLGYRKRIYDNYTEQNLNRYSTLTLDSFGKLVFTNSNYDSSSSNNLNYNNVDVSMFIYNNSKVEDNNFLLKYEHIVGHDSPSTNQVYLSEGLSLQNFIANYKPKNINQPSDLNGGFLIPNLLNKTQLQCSNETNNQYIKLDVGSSISIPILFEYYLDGTSETGKSVTKTIAFDLKPSLVKDQDFYIINVTAKYDLSLINNNLNNIASLQDRVIDA